MADDTERRPAYQPLSESTVSARLAEIRRRCGDLLDDNGDLALSLEDEPAAGVAPGGGFNPYDHGA